MKKLLKIGILSSILILIVLSILTVKFGAHHWVRNKLNPNIVKVETVGEIDREKVKVIWTSYQKSKVVFENGKDLKKYFKEYGKNKFQVFYDNDLVGEFGQFKYNNWHGQEYKILLEVDTLNKIQYSVVVVGPDQERVWTDKEHGIL